MECGMTFVKYILFLFNLIFTLSGLVMVVAGACILVSIKDFNFMVDSRTLGPPITLVIVGLIVFAVAFLGCYGAIKENYSLLIAFAVALMVIFIVELAIGIAGAVFKNDFQAVMRKSMNDSMISYTSSDELAWEKVHKTFECCGIDGPNDWVVANTVNKRPSETLPNTCCKDLQYDNGCQASIQSGQNSPYKQGCWTILEARMESSVSVLIGIGIGIAIMEIIGIVFACCLAMTIKKDAEVK